MSMARQSKSKKSPEELLVELEGDNSRSSDRADDSGIGINLFDYLVSSTTTKAVVDSQTAAELSYSSVHSSTSTASGTTTRYRRQPSLRVKRYTEEGDEINIQQNIPESALNSYSHEGAGSISSFLSLNNASSRSFQRSHEGSTGNRAGRVKRYQNRNQQPSTISSHGDEDDDYEKAEMERTFPSPKNDTFMTVSTEEGNVIIRNHDTKYDQLEVDQDQNNTVHVSTPSALSHENIAPKKSLAEKHQSRAPTAQSISSPAYGVDLDGDSSSDDDDDDNMATPIHAGLADSNAYPVVSKKPVSVRMGNNSQEREPEEEDIMAASSRARESITKQQEDAVATAAAIRHADKNKKNIPKEKKAQGHEFEINHRVKAKSVQFPEENGGNHAAINDDVIRERRRSELEQRKRQLEAIAKAAVVQKGNLASTYAPMSHKKSARQRTLNIDVYTGEVIAEMPKIGTMLSEGRRGGNGNGADAGSSSSYSSTEYDITAEKRQCNLRTLVIVLILLGTGLGIYFGLYFNKGEDEADVSSAANIPLEVEMPGPSAAPSFESTFQPSLRPAMLGSLTIPSPFFNQGEASMTTVPPTNRPSSSAAQSSPILDNVDPELLKILVEEWPILSQAIEKESSPQLRALEWLSLDEALESYSLERKKQRFALVTFFYSTGGENWKQNDQWLSSADECLWFTSIGEGLQCNIGGLYTSLEMNSNSLNGTIPAELGLLSNNLYAIDFSDNNLRGNIPSESGRLTNLLRMDLSGNILSGTIPSTLGELTQLRDYLDLSENELSGPIPLEFGRLLLLRQIMLQSNQLSGNFPTSFRALGSLNTVRVESNLLTGSVPESVCAVFNNSYAVVVADCVSALECVCCSYCCSEMGGCDCQFEDVSGLQFLCNGYP